MELGAAPLHQRLKGVILEQIGRGDWLPHSQIASERELCERYQISRTTARRAIADLVHEGRLYTVLGKGTFVAETPLQQELKPLVGFTEDLGTQGLEITSQVLDFRRVEADEELATRLGVRYHSPIILLVRLRQVVGEPVALQTSYLPEHLCPGLLGFDFTSASLYQTLRSEYQLALTEGRTIIKSGLATEAERERLHLPNPAAVLRTFQTTYLQTGEIVEWCASVFHGDHFELTSKASAEGQVQYHAHGSREPQNVTSRG